MRRLKLSICLCLALVTLVFLGYQNTSSRASDKSSRGFVPSPPTGVSASDADYANKVGIMWDTMRGAVTYRVFRNTTNNSATATEVGTSVANEFYDMTAVPDVSYFYWVRAENAAGNSGMSAAVQGKRGVLGESPGPYVPQEPPLEPLANPVTAAKAALGKALFWDEQMSSTNTVACGTCHRPAEGGADPRTVIGELRSRNPGFDQIPNNGDDVFGSPGVPRNNFDGTYESVPYFGLREQVTNRKAPSYLNAGYAISGLFWDGRATPEFRDPITNTVLIASGASIESQVLGPPLSDAEMGHAGRDWPQVASKIAAASPLILASDIPDSLVAWIDGRTYPELFEEAFGTPEVTPARIAMAIATHERHLISDRTPFDRWAAGMGGLTESEERGGILFFGKQCNQCHSDAIFSDNFFHNIGVRPQHEDRGRGGITNDPKHDGQFKTPTLRNVELHGPYMHNGRFGTLEEVVDFYNRGGDFDAPNIDRGVIRPMAMTAQEKADLAAFMKRPLTDPRVANELPPFDRPQLYTESTHVPVITGTGRTGSGGLTPNAIAIEPPFAGNPSFTVAVDSALGNTSAVIVIDSTDPGVGTSIPASGSLARVQITLAGTGSGNGTGSASIAIPGAAVGQKFFGRWYVTDPAAANGFAVSRLFTFTVFGEGAGVADDTHVDFDGDGKTDISIFRPSLGQWWYLQSSDGTAFGHQFGDASDKIVPADYTGDGKTDVAIWRESAGGNWYVLRSEDSTFYAFPFGMAGDIPAPGDFDADGKADATVFRPSTGTWYTLRSSDQQVSSTQFGGNGDVPQAGDFDGDGNADIAVYRPNGTNSGEWWIRRSSDSGVEGYGFGLSTDIPVAADLSGDGKTDIAVWRPSTGFWYAYRSEDMSLIAIPFGSSGDIPATGDYDGDGTFDTAIFRPSSGTWYLNLSTGGLQVTQFGIAGDKPAPAAYTP